MGRKLEGVEIRESSLRITFTFNGKYVKETLYLNENDPMAPSPANIKYAARLADEVKHQIRQGTFIYADHFPYSPNVTKAAPRSLSEFIDTWLAQLDVKSSTLKSYTRIANNFWKIHLGGKTLTKIKRSDITTALKHGTWKSGKTRNNVVSVLSSVLDLALADDLIPKNPCEGIDAAAWQRKKPDPFTLDEAELIVAHMREKYPEQVANFYEFMFFAGLRTSEGIGLEWTEVDFNSKTVLVKQGFVIDALEDTKTSRERTVKLNSRALAALIRQKAWTFIAGGRVFLDPGTEKPWAYEQNARKRYWTPTLKKLGIRYRRPYCTRHTCATMGLMAGMNPAYMAGQLGHGVEVFFRDYSTWITGKSDDREMDKMEAMLSAAEPGFFPEFSPAGLLRR